jgi:hypothetical protein
MAQGFDARPDVTLGWNPTAGAAPITNYTVYWGTNSGVYGFHSFAGLATNFAVTGLLANTVYYVAVTETDQHGLESIKSGEIMFTNAPLVLPPTPPGPGGTNGSGATNIANVGGGGSGGSGGSTNSAGSSGEVAVPGVPPVLTLRFTNNHPLLTISGTMASALLIQHSTNAGSPAAWNTITNLTLTNATGLTNPGASALLSLAFAPATQDYEVVDAAPPAGEFYQVVMPYDYMVLADAVLSGNGYPSRLLLVRMPGITAADVCYVTPQGSFIYYDAYNRAFAVESSGSTIRQIATTLSASLSQNWTSASEFAYSNGVSTILATVVETEPPSSDPVAGTATASIQIDF